MKMPRPITSFSLSIPAKKNVVPNNIENSKIINEIVDRPQTRSSLAVKSWRASLFPISSPASRREVELLGEWLNSVLAENLEINDNPLDVCTNAQHWFSVAFNELVRQVSVTCAERGRLFAIIWKRNQDLLSKLVQIQRSEREYVLSCHKDRMQFLKADLDFCQSRLNTIMSAYNEEKERWQSSHERDISKFDNLQKKIDEQISNRKQLLIELNQLKGQLGILPQGDNEVSHDDSIFSYNENLLQSRIKFLREKMQLGKIDNLDMVNLIEDIDHFVLYQSYKTHSHEIRAKYESYFLSLPSEHKPNLRTVQWLYSAISCIYSFYINHLEQNDPGCTSRLSLTTFIYDLYVTLYGSREIAEQTLLDLLCTAQDCLQSSKPRVTSFCRFVGIIEPVPVAAFNFYIFALCALNREHPGPLFPEVEAGEPMSSGIPTPAACQAAEKVLTRFTEGRTYQFYTERVKKIASDGFLMFGGRNLSEIDPILDYLVTAYIEESAKIDDMFKEQVERLPQAQIVSYTQFYTTLQLGKTKPDPSIAPSYMKEILFSTPSCDPITHESFLPIIQNYSFNIPFSYQKEDFISIQNPDDVIKYTQNELEFYQCLYDSTVKLISDSSDDILLKQLKSNRAKLDQAISSRSLGRTFILIHREYYEKIVMANLFVNKKNL